MTVLSRLVETLENQGTPFAVIGAAALPLLGVVRSTVDLDLLTTDPRVLEPRTWQGLQDGGVAVEIRRGGAEDPLAGVVRLSASGEREVDLVVGRTGWQRRAVLRARPLPVADFSLPVVQGSDLVLLKLYAGGPQDAWDIAQVLAADDTAALIAEVERDLPDLPRRCRELWERIRAEGPAPIRGAGPV